MKSISCKYVYLVLLVVLAGACVGKGDKQSAVSQETETLVIPADSFAIDSTVYECRVTRWNHAEYDVEEELKWDDWRPKDCEVMLSENILVADHPAQAYHVYEKGPWICTEPGVLSCILHVVDQDDIDCSIILKAAADYHVLMYVLYDDEAFCYDMEILPAEDDTVCYD